MKKCYLVILLIVLLLLINYGIMSIDNVGYNTYINDEKYRYSIEKESIKFTYKFLNNVDKNLNENYLFENTYESYKNGKSKEIKEYLNKINIKDKVNNEVVLVRGAKQYEETTKLNECIVIAYVTEKKNNYNSLGALPIKDSNVDANKQMYLSIKSYYPYDFKIAVPIHEDVSDEIKH